MTFSTLSTLLSSQRFCALCAIELSTLLSEAGFCYYLEAVSLYLESVGGCVPQ